jgi:hypothetical protein
MSSKTAFSKCAKDFNAKAKALAEKTSDAYSADRYGKRSWLANTKYLLAHFTEVQVEWILRSKNMRWAADCNETRSNSIPKNTMEKWHRGGNLDNDAEMPGMAESVDFENRIKKLARIAELKTELAKLEAEVRA